MSNEKSTGISKEAAEWREKYWLVCLERDHWKIRAQRAEAHYVEAIEIIGALQVKRCEDLACERRRK